MAKYTATVRERRFFNEHGGYVILPERSYPREYAPGFSPFYPLSDVLVLQDYRRDLDAFAQFVTLDRAVIDWKVSR